MASRHVKPVSVTATRRLFGAGAVAAVVAAGAIIWAVSASGTGGGPAAGDTLTHPAASTSSSRASSAPPAATTVAPTTRASTSPSPAPSRPARTSSSATRGAPSKPPARKTATQSAVPVLTPTETRKCASGSLACVDLDKHITWLQANGKVIYGPVHMMPGMPNEPTPTGVFAVQYKARHHVSNEYFEPMPFSVFFAAGGIAFHQGSLTNSSHGCVHLAEKDASTYFMKLQPGDQVAVFA